MNNFELEDIRELEDLDVSIIQRTVMPSVFSNNPTERKAREEHFMAIAKKSYPNCKQLTKKDYERIKNNWSKENYEVVDELLEKSIQPIIEATVKIYAKYNINIVVPFEEGLSNIISELMLKIQNFDRLPKIMETHTVSTINYFAFRTLMHIFTREYNQAKNCIPKPSNYVNDEIDKKFAEEIVERDMLINDLQIPLKSALYSLSVKEYTVLHLRYSEQLTLDEIANMMSLSKAGVCRIIKTALRKLQHSPYGKKLESFKSALEI